MGILALVNGVLTSFGGTTTALTTSDADTQDLLKQMIVEQRLTNELLRGEMSPDTNLDDLREEISGAIE